MMKKKSVKKTTVVSKELPTKKLDRLMQEAINIARQGHILANRDYSLPVQRDGEIMAPKLLFERYQCWFNQIKLLLNQSRVTLKLDIGIFFEEPSLIVMPLGAFVHRKVFAEDIIVKIEKKLSWLRENNSKLKKLLLCTISQRPTGKITKITFIESKQGRYSLAVNDNYRMIKKVRKNSDWWGKLIQIAKGKIPETISKGMKDYFNYNQKCPIYFEEKYKLSEIFIGRGDYDTQLNADIKVEVINEQTLKRRQGKWK